MWDLLSVARKREGPIRIEDVSFPLKPLTAKTKFLSVQGEQSYIGWTEYLQPSFPSPSVIQLFESIFIVKGVKEKVFGVFF